MLSGTFLVFAGCNKPKPENTLVPPAVPDVEDGVHDFEVGATEYDLVKDGATDYVIVVPEDAGEIIEFAAGELQYFLGEATGASSRWKRTRARAILRLRNTFPWETPRSPKARASRRPRRNTPFRATA